MKTLPKPTATFWALVVALVLWCAIAYAVAR
jgi:hypothetical protein